MQHICRASEGLIRSANPLCLHFDELAGLTCLAISIHLLQKYHTTHGGDVQARKEQYADMVNKYYDLATSFYEYGGLYAVLCVSYTSNLYGLTHCAALRQYANCTCAAGQSALPMCAWQVPRFCYAGFVHMVCTCKSNWLAVFAGNHAAASG
eukprot:GHRR01022980.1.p1 GENE.GHRR01022980.1~~GHRR01022980.1.p1  ORF type:complete len:152 (+),score=22.77 GHRR01022980.1:758-1213(+)